MAESAKPPSWRDRPKLQCPQCGRLVRADPDGKLWLHYRANPLAPPHPDTCAGSWTPGIQPADEEA